MGKKLACITIDIESDLNDPQQRIRMFENNDIGETYEDIIRTHCVKVTGFVVTSLIPEHGPSLNGLSERIPIEYGVHSHTHDLNNPCTKEEVGKSVRAYREFWHGDPLGYRAPAGLIDGEGINNLLTHNFEYDASIFPSLRVGEKGNASPIHSKMFDNFRLPIEPFELVQGEKRILELPFACLPQIRLLFTMSYVKLLGLRPYQALTKIFPLPDIVVLGSHPYDFYTPLIADGLNGWMKKAHLRNGGAAFDLFEQIIEMLKRLGYEFVFMSELSRHVRENVQLRQMPVDKLK